MLSLQPNHQEHQPQPPTNTGTWTPGKGLIPCMLLAQVPLKRVNQAYVIATSTKVDLKGSDVSKLEDSHFKAADKPKEKKGEEGFFKKDTEPEEKVSIRTMQPC